jgi:hypothetical protein
MFHVAAACAHLEVVQCFAVIRQLGSPLFPHLASGWAVRLSPTLEAEHVAARALGFTVAVVKRLYSALAARNAWTPAHVAIVLYV